MEVISPSTITEMVSYILQDRTCGITSKIPFPKDVFHVDEYNELDLNWNSDNRVTIPSCFSLHHQHFQA